MLSESIMTAAAIVGGLTVIFGGVVSIYKIARRLDDTIGTDDSGKTVADRLSKVEYQLWENGGESLADRVNRIEKHAQHTATEVSLIKDILLNMVGAATQPAQKRARKARGTAPAFGLVTFDDDDK
jgi:hypothetical protein